MFEDVNDPIADAQGLIRPVSDEVHDDELQVVPGNTPLPGLRHPEVMKYSPQYVQATQGKLTSLVALFTLMLLIVASFILALTHSADVPQYVAPFIGPISLALGYSFGKASRSSQGAVRFRGTRCC